MLCMEKDSWIEKVRQALESEGFRHTPPQIQKEGQLFGLVKKIDNIWEMGNAYQGIYR